MEETRVEKVEDKNLLVLATGESVDKTDVDELVTAYESVDRAYQIAKLARVQLASALGMLTPDIESRTRRVEGEERRAKVEMPADQWEGSILREAFHSFPQHRDRCLKISQVDLRKREWAKLEGTKGPKSLEAFIGMIRRAYRGPCGTPRITVEK